MRKPILEEQWEQRGGLTQIRDSSIFLFPNNTPESFPQRLDHGVVFPERIAYEVVDADGQSIRRRAGRLVPLDPLPEMLYKTHERKDFINGNFFEDMRVLNKYLHERCLRECRHGGSCSRAWGSQKKRTK
jgi:hypothetical protein